MIMDVYLITTFFNKVIKRGTKGFLSIAASHHTKQRLQTVTANTGEDLTIITQLQHLRVAR